MWTQYSVCTYLQWTTMGLFPVCCCVRMTWSIRSIMPAPVLGAPLSGHEMKWYCFTVSDLFSADCGGACMWRNTGMIIMQWSMCIQYVWRYDSELPNLNLPIFLLELILGNPPNFPATYYNYTVLSCSYKYRSISVFTFRYTDWIAGIHTLSLVTYGDVGDLELPADVIFKRSFGQQLHT